MVPSQPAIPSAARPPAAVDRTGRTSALVIMPVSVPGTTDTSDSVWGSEGPGLTPPRGGPAEMAGPHQHGCDEDHHEETDPEAEIEGQMVPDVVDDHECPERHQ